MLLSCIIGFKNKQTDILSIKKNLEKCLLYHFFVSDLHDPETREEFKNHDSITHKAGGAYIDHVSKNLLTNPKIISSKLTKELFNKLLLLLYIESNNPYERKLENGKEQNKNRRTLKFFQKTLYFYFYKEKIPTNMLENEFSIEHICPNSSEWDGKLDKDRTGNLIPILSTTNSLRGNKHIDEYCKTKNCETLYTFMTDIIPERNIYNNIISHGKKPMIKSNESYNNMCDKNEYTYAQNLIGCLNPW